MMNDNLANLGKFKFKLKRIFKVPGKVKAAISKIGKAVGSVIKKVAPIASLIPGVSVIAGAAKIAKIASIAQKAKQIVSSSGVKAAETFVKQQAASAGLPATVTTNIIDTAEGKKVMQLMTPEVAQKKTVENEAQKYADKKVEEVKAKMPVIYSLFSEAPKKAIKKSDADNKKKLDKKKEELKETLARVKKRISEVKTFLNLYKGSNRDNFIKRLYLIEQEYNKINKEIESKGTLKGLAIAPIVVGAIVGVSLLTAVFLLGKYVERAKKLEADVTTLLKEISASGGIQKTSVITSKPQSKSMIENISDLGNAALIGGIAIGALYLFKKKREF